MHTIFLIGYMACGKTTLGTLLARELHMPFIDLDNYIEEHCEMTISNIFDKWGEKHFRTLEHEALRQVARSCAVVACGGGTPCHEGNMQLMNSTGTTVWLTASASCIASRLCRPSFKASRPLVAKLSNNQILDFVTQQLAKRTLHYSQAHIIFDATRIETAQESVEIAHALAACLLNQE